MSRHPTFGPRGYDKSLLEIAPRITREDRQQGYSVDILEQGGQSNVYRPQFGPNPPPHQHFARAHEELQYQQPAPSSSDHSVPPPLERVEYFSSPAALDQRDVYTIDPYKPPTKPWFRTKRGLAIIILIFLVFVGVVVGIALGVSAATNRANRGVPEGVERGSTRTASVGGALKTNNPEALPSLPPLETVPFTPSSRPASTAPPGVLLTLNSAVAAVPVATTPARVPSTTAVIARPT